MIARKGHLADFLALSFFAIFMGRDEFGHFYGIYGIPLVNDSCDISKGSFHYDF